MILKEQINEHIIQFHNWLNLYGETSQDFQDYYANKYGIWAKETYYKRNIVVGHMAVFPLVFLEAFMPWTRKWFSHPLRYPIADSHYAMGYIYLFKYTGKQEYYDRAVHYLGMLIESRCKDNYGWGYPFHWTTKMGVVKSGTPLITVTPYVYEAFNCVYGIDCNIKWLEIMKSIAEHVLRDYNDTYISENVSASSYTPYDHRLVVNASAYRSSLLFNAAKTFSENEYLERAEQNRNFVLKSQQEDGSWLYAMDFHGDFIDNIHTCFVLKSLIKGNNIYPSTSCDDSIQRGIQYYLRNLLDSNKLPKPFSKEPRITIYRKELYDYGEFLNISYMLYDICPLVREVIPIVLNDLFKRWARKDGSFRTRQLLIGWNNVPFHRWGYSQLFRSLCQLLLVND